MRTSLVVGALSLLGAEATRAESISLLAQSHRAWGYLQEIAYEEVGGAPVAGGCALLVDGDPPGVVTLASDTFGSSERSLRVYASATSEDPWSGFSHAAHAEVSYDFVPRAETLHLSFTGSAGHHAADGQLSFSLIDLVSGAVLDERTWEYELDFGWVDEVLPADFAYVLDPSHTYRMTAAGSARLGDLRAGFAMLEVQLAPEPAALLLLLLGALLARPRPAR